MGIKKIDRDFHPIINHAWALFTSVIGQEPESPA